MVQKELKEGRPESCPNSFFAVSQASGASTTSNNKSSAQNNILRKRSDKRILNTNIWNNFKVSSQTGFTIEMLKPCLYDLSKFIEEYLEPNKLKYFDIEAIPALKDCQLNDSRHGRSKPVNIELIQ